MGIYINLLRKSWNSEPNRGQDFPNYHKSEEKRIINGVLVYYHKNGVCEPVTCTTAAIPYQDKVFIIDYYAQLYQTIPQTEEQLKFFNQILSTFKFIESTANWKTYINTKYKFSIKYPVGWAYLETPNKTYQVENDQLWITHSDFPPPGIGARADIVFIFTSTNPSSNWESKYFDDYKTEKYVLGNIPATKISGINKEGRMEELVVIAKVGETYIQVLPNQGPESLQYFDLILSTFKFLD